MRQLLWIACLVLCAAYLVLYAVLVLVWLVNRGKKERTGTGKEDVRISGEDKETAGEESGDTEELPNERTETPAAGGTENLASEITAAIYPELHGVETGMSSVIGTRSYQQDAVRIAAFGGGDNHSPCVTGVLCDGMGGMEGGEYASNTAADRMIEMAQSVTADYPGFFEQAILRINREIAGLHDVSGRKLEAGTTLTCVIVDEDRLYWCSVGDSRIYLCRNGQIRQLSTDHNYGTMVDELIRAGKMKPEEVNPLEKREALTSYLGAAELEQIGGNVKPIRLKAGDTVIQCSDGLYRCLSEQDLIRILGQAPDLDRAAEAMTRAAVSLPGSHDNTSVILIRYKGTV